MPQPPLRQAVARLSPYVPGLSIAEIRDKYHLTQVIKMASNENPLGMPPLAVEAVRRHADGAFRYPQGGNPRLVRALAHRHGVAENRVVVGNGSDEILDLLIRVLCEPGRHNIVCCDPCFSIYPIQAQLCGVATRRQPLNADFSFDFAALLDLVDKDTRLVFLTTPDNPSGYCPPRQAMADMAQRLGDKAPACLLAVDEAYMDFGDDEAAASLLASGMLPDNVAVTRTFSKSFGLAGLRLGYAVLPESLADGLWRARLPFSVNLLAEEAALAALADTAFHEATLHTVRQGRAALAAGLKALGCAVWPTQANFLMFRPPHDGPSAAACHEALLRRGIIIRPLTSYGLPGHLRVSVGDAAENRAFLAALRDILATGGDAA